MPAPSRDPDDKGITARLARGGKRGAKESLRSASAPIVSYFDRRFADLQHHFDRRFAEMSAQFATEVETVSELTLGMQRLVDLSAEHVERLVAAAMSSGVGLGLGARDSSDVPDAAIAAFAVAASAHVPAGAPVLVGGRGSGWLGTALASLGYDVTPAGEDGPDKWAGRFAGVFWNGTGEGDGDGVDAERAGELLSWLVPGGQLVVALPAGATPAIGSDWDVVDTRSASEQDVVLMRAVPRQ